MFIRILALCVALGALGFAALAAEAPTLLPPDELFIPQPPIARYAKGAVVLKRPKFVVYNMGREGPHAVTFWVKGLGPHSSAADSTGTVEEGNALAVSDFVAIINEHGVRSRVVTYMVRVYRINADE